MEFSDKTRWNNLDEARKLLTMRYIELTFALTLSNTEEMELRALMINALEWDDWDLVDAPDFVVQDVLRDKHPHIHLH